MASSAVRIISLLLVVLGSGACHSSASTPVSSSDFVAQFPERADALFAGIDLSRPGLQTVASSVEAGDHVAAADALLEYYRTSGTGQWLRSQTGVHDPGGFDDNVVQLADDTLEDIFLLQGIRGKARRDAQGAIDWQYRGPQDDIEWALFTNRHFVLIPLLKAYAESGDTRYVDYINAFLQEWITDNLPPEEGEDEYDMSPVWQPMSTASRLLQVWPQLFYFLQDEDQFSDATRLLMLSTIVEQAEHLKRFHREKHNHAVKEMAGLGHAAAAWPEFRGAPAWSTYSVRTLHDEINRQVYPTGVQKELSSHYQRTVLEYVAQYVVFSQAAGIELPGDFVGLVESMADYLARTMKPDGHILLNNDADRDFIRNKLLGLADQFERPDWQYVASYGEQGEIPAGLPSSHYPYAGHLISRSDWSADAQWSFFDIGPWGISHQHNDRLHLSVHAGPRNLLVDTGRVNYIKDNPKRQHIISSAAHNVILVDGVDQGPQEPERFAPVESAALITESFDFAVGSVDDGFPDADGEVQHARALYYLRNKYWLVVDRIVTDRPRTITALWHFHPETAAEVDENLDTVTIDADQPNLRIRPVGDLDWHARVINGQEEPEVQGWYSPVYNTVVATDTAVYDASIDGNAMFAWLITTGTGTPPQLETTFESADDSEFHVIVIDGESQPVSVRFEGTDTRRPDGGWVAEAVLVSGE